MTENPWLSIPASDYEGHMSAPAVKQAQFLSHALEDLLSRFEPSSIVVPGCTTGNGFEHVDPTVTRAVVGIDINPDYLALLETRHGARIPGLKLLCEDAADAELPPGSADLVHCALVFEYADPKRIIANAARWLRAGGVLSVILQLPAEGQGKVTATEFESVRSLEAMMRLVPPPEIDRTAADAGLKPIETRVATLETGKKFHLALYRRP